MAQLVMGPGQKFFVPGRVRSIFCGSGQVGSAIYGLGLNSENFPQKMSNFSIFFPSGWVKKYPGQRLVGLLFTAGQK